ncbi:MAG: L,D-transpeptidase [Saprospiraceae bacterium]|nr:L,D-transpeptidase [Saprospiraceae bacterium]MCF8251997.1 L,D-transpeptidase [Saprospiraceae bacterium]MCF8281668.1 L,D-transpeptidase [Bacteroidales bacterium]MCF8313656.1 L,D-transpeptidase [Saprospiraceae bacterium]MCF8442363.1 L,D-transpeptidase [Saprospiraceae bacterium]
MNLKSKQIFLTASLTIFVSTALFLSCKNKAEKPPQSNIEKVETIVPKDTIPTFPAFDTVVLSYDVTISCLFDFLDTLVAHYDTLAPYPVSEHLLVRANPWLIDSLENTDYYRLKERGIFNFDNRLLVVMHEGDTFFIPNETKARELLRKMENTVLDINIPEFKLRIIENGDTIHTFPVRVGQNRKRYLLATDRVTDLRTRTGTGTIDRISKDPFFRDPVDGRMFNITKRDDNKKTRMPLIPWIEPKLNGQRTGQMIHPTSNPKSVGKAYSNGCVGTKEADAWRIYYYAPLGTKVVFRYDLEVINEQGDTLRLKDIYKNSLTSIDK